MTLPQAAGGVSGFGVHPALLDAALHAAVVTHAGAGVALPFSWQGVSLHAAGASAVRARIAPSGPSAVSVELADGLGLPVLTVTSMVARPVSQQQLTAALSGATGDRLFELAWSPASSASHAETPSFEVFESAPADGDPVAASYERVHTALAALQTWLAEHESGVLVVSTRGAVGLPREDVTDLAGAAVWGLVRSAQTEHPGRIVLVDSDAPLSDSIIAERAGGRESNSSWSATRRSIPRGSAAAVPSTACWCRPPRGRGASACPPRERSRTCSWSRCPTPMHRWNPAGCASPCGPSPPISATS